MLDEDRGVTQEEIVEDTSVVQEVIKQASETGSKEVISKVRTER
jgi:hypothetical protein